MFERVLKSRIVREYRNFFKTSDANFIFLMYLLMGGFVFESKVSTRTKRLYYLASSICCMYLVMASVPCVYYGLIESDKLDVVYITTAVQFTLLPVCVVCTDIFSFVYRSDIMHVIRQIDDEFAIDWKRIGNEHVAAVPQSSRNATAKSNFEKHWSIVASMNGVLLIAVVSLRYVWAFVIGFDKTMNNYFYFIGPVWGIEKNDSLTRYTIYTLGHTVCLTFVMTKATAVALFFISVSDVYYDYFIKLAHIMDADSSFVRESIEPIELQRWKMARTEIDQMSVEISLSFGKRCRDYLQAYRKIRA